jgi:hypothetical protein
VPRGLTFPEASGGKILVPINLPLSIGTNIRRYWVFRAMKAMRIGLVFTYNILILEREKGNFFLPIYWGFSTFHEIRHEI